MKTPKLFLCLLLALLVPRFASALIVGPYTPDANTVYLFHFDEPAGSYIATNAPGALAAGTNALAYSTVGVNVFPGVGIGAPTNFNAFGATGASGFTFGNFGKAAVLANLLNAATNGFGVDMNKNGSFSLDNLGTAVNDMIANHTSIVGANNSITLEALVNLSTTNANQEIVCTDNGGATAARGFQFRLSGPVIEFNAIGSTPAGFTTPIPSSGTHGFVANQWYHIALVHTESPSIGTVIYWTRLSDTPTAANAIFTNTVETVDATDPLLLVIGNEGRSAGSSLGSSEGFNGMIDEVRISNVARAANQMQFASALVAINQQPLVQEGVDYGGTIKLSVNAGSLLPLFYQWRLNGTPVSGATNATYLLTNATAANAGNYDCVITNSNPSSATSSACVVSIGAANFLAHRYGFTNDVTDSFGTANGTAWGNANVSGGALQLDGTTGTYLQLPAGLVTNQAAITIEAWASFSTIANNSFFFGFGDTNGANGQTYIFCTPHGTTARIAITPASFGSEQGAVSGNSLDNRTGIQIVAVYAPYIGYEALYTNGVLAAINTNVTIQLSAVVDNYSFVGRSLFSGDPYLTGSVDEFRIYNGAMSASSILQSYQQGPNNSLNDGPVQFLTSPADTTVAQGLPVTFSSVTSGHQPVVYQWFKNGIAIAGATNASYTYSPTFADNGKSFVVRATNTISAVDYAAASSPATLTVLVPESLAWLGATDNGWNLSSLNWSNSAQALVAFAQYDGAVFDDRGTGQPGVDLQFAVTPVSLTVSNTVSDYQIYSASANGSLGVIGTLLKQGSSKLTLDVVNISTGPTVVQNGTLQVGNNDALGSLGSGVVTNNAVLSFSRNDAALVVANPIHGTGAVSFDGSGTVNVAGSNDYTGTTTVNVGIVNLQSALGLGTTNGGTTVASGAQIYVTANVDIGSEALTLGGSGPDGNGAIRKGGAGATTYSGGVNLTADSTIGVDGNAALTLNSPLGISGAAALTKNGNGTLALNSKNSYSGGTTLTAGIININTNGALGTGDVNSSGGRFVIADGLNVTNSITASAVAPGAATGFLMVNDNTNGAVTTISGPIALNAVALNGGHFAGPTTSGYLDITGPITVPPFTPMIVRLGNVRFSGGGSVPQMQVRANRTSIGANNGVAVNAVMDIGGNGSTTVPTYFDLNGFNQTLAGLQNFVTPANLAVVTNSGSAVSTLTLDLGTGSSWSFSGSIAGKVALTLNSGTENFTGTNNYTGNTTVNGGTLELATPSIASNSTVTVASGGILQLDFSTTNTIGALVLNGVSQAPGAYDSTTAAPYLAGPGILLVVPPVNPTPTNVVARVNGGNLELSWPADHTGWRLQVQTNSLATGLNTNWLDVPNANTVSSVTNVINSANGAVFYRLIYP